tara:strand:- start:420 stop:602 length:183 start_codon:yes stop_codon:yes gene_type:complete
MRKKMSDEPIVWGWNEPTYQRSKDHREYLIQNYNKDKPEDQHVHTIEELNNALRKEKENK